MYDLINRHDLWLRQGGIQQEVRKKKESEVSLLISSTSSMMTVYIFQRQPTVYNTFPLGSDNCSIPSFFILRVAIIQETLGP